MELCEKRFVMNESPTAACHASTIYRKKNGEILTAWFGGSQRRRRRCGNLFFQEKRKWRFSGSRKNSWRGGTALESSSFFRG